MSASGLLGLAADVTTSETRRIKSRPAFRSSMRKAMSWRHRESAAARSTPLNIVEFEWCVVFAGRGDRSARLGFPLVVSARGLCVAHCPPSHNCRDQRERSLQLIEHFRHRALHLQGLFDFISAEEGILAVFKETRTWCCAQTWRIRPDWSSNPSENPRGSRTPY